MNPNPNPYEPMLKESINRFFAEHRRGVTNFSDFTTIFSRVVHATADPPIPILWFYAALEFRAARQPSKSARDLFQLLVSCSGAIESTKRIAALAPLVFVLHRLALRRGEFWSEVEGLVEGVISYCSIFCGKDVCDGDVAVLEFGDLIKVWMVDDDGGGGVFGDCAMEGFFPLVSEEFRKGIVTGCDVGVLAGVVMCEALLLKLCLAFEKGISRVELEKDLLASAVQTMTGFRSFRFLVLFLQHFRKLDLDETQLCLFILDIGPILVLSGVTSLQFSCLFFLIADWSPFRYPFQDDVGASFASDLFTEVTQASENQVLLKEVLYNSVMMIDYSFINPQGELSLYANSLKDVAITWLFVAELAVQSAREKGHQGKAMSYINAFCGSCIPVQLINWVTSQDCLGRKISRPNVSTPIALLKWLLVVEEQGIAVFAGETAKQIDVMFKANFFTTRTECLLPVIKHFFNNLDKNLFFNSTNGEAGADTLDGDIDMLDTVDSVSLAAADSLSTVIDGTRKRKEGIDDDSKTPLKYMRCHIHENSVRENPFTFKQQ
ncbi:unnamed protein product [Sphenostylis stenocarpa]|uniref:Uncharacterized protein n=1 Tax=Sphenostylis stenocarpa TaxID=92480 RepID=A0AA86T2C4_9FABA|nr:unnamed protein product [Sphenostylis stenocarpa]